ncbi:Uncharacterized protein Adt_15823 [Abeliophyllum distichum]|uniref:Uncharacterized protein n=1 Tax=Abeliophyllum distichum TaxID=126358 RepID=A0ABD1U3J9_9LAMI
MQFLMGLSDSYSTVRGNILMMSPFPVIRRVHAILMQHERQVEVATDHEGQHSINWKKSNRKSYNRPNRSTGSSYRSTISSETGQKQCAHCGMLATLLIPAISSMASLQGTSFMGRT